MSIQKCTFILTHKNINSNLFGKKTQPFFQRNHHLNQTSIQNHGFLQASWQPPRETTPKKDLFFSLPSCNTIGTCGDLRLGGLLTSDEKSDKSSQPFGSQRCHCLDHPKSYKNAVAEWLPREADLRNVWSGSFEFGNFWPVTFLGGNFFGNLQVVGWV